MGKNKMLLFVVIFIFIASACDKYTQTNYIESEYDIINDLNGVTLDIKENTLSSTGLTAVVYNGCELDLTFGEYYCIEKKIDGNWCQVPYVEQENDIGWNDIGYDVSANETYVFEPTNWEWLYGTLDAGEYRFIKDAIVGIDGDITTYHIAVEFSLSE